MRTGVLLFAAVFAVGVVGGCNCRTNTQRRFGEINADPVRVDFGTVQVGLTHEKTVRIYNSGAAALNMHELRVAAPFGVKEQAPVVVSPGSEATLTITFTPPTADKREQGQLVIASDDQETPELTIELAGIGVSAQATATPNPVDFGDVYVGESKMVTLTIHNGGSNELTVLGAEFISGTPAAVTGDLAPLSMNIPGGGDAQTTLTFQPTAMMNAIPGGVRLELDPNQGGELVIPFSGRGVQAIPRICFKFEDSPMETCTAANAGSGVGTNLNIDFPPLCDRSVSPPDAGTTAVICGGAPYEKSGRFYVRNEGNVPVKYSLKYIAATSKSCDGGTPEVPDFHFSNQPDGGVVWNEPTTQLPAMPMDPMPWETGGVTVTYAPTAGCIDEAADQARIEWTRQGDTRQPILLFAFLSGQSKLPQAVDHGLTVTGGTPSTLPFYGADNRGNAAFQITSATLYEVVTGIPGGACQGPDAGIFQPCPPNPTALSECAQFAWADGGNPNLTAPHTVPPADGGIANTVQIGAVVFGPNASNPPQFNQNYCVFSVVETTDPFQPQVVSKIQARKVQ